MANKVFSPQYLLWVLPLVPLVDFEARKRRMFFAAIFAICFLTMRIFPDCFVGEIVWPVPGGGEVAAFDGPTPYGAFLLLTRNALCLAVTGVLAVGLYRKGMRQESGHALPFAALRVAAKQAL